MDYGTFEASLTQTQPPKGVSEELRALWLAKNGQWEAAHEIVQDMKSPHAGLVHGFLHWQEGDLWNADYWYRSAGQVREGNLEEEWKRLVTLML